jgi:hypothetical protein
MRLDSNLPTRLDFPEPVPPAIPITIIDLLSVLNRFFVLQGIIAGLTHLRSRKKVFALGLPKKMLAAKDI